MLQIVYIDGDCKIYNVKGKIRFGSKSLNFTSMIGREVKLNVVDYVRINSFLIL